MNILESSIEDTKKCLTSTHESMSMFEPQNVDETMSKLIIFQNQKILENQIVIMQTLNDIDKNVNS